jgi:hypothetical protein
MLMTGILPSDVAQRLGVGRKCSKEQLARALVDFGHENLSRSNVYFLRSVCAATEAVHYFPPKRSVVEAVISWAAQHAM